MTVTTDIEQLLWNTQSRVGNQSGFDLWFGQTFEATSTSFAGVTLKRGADAAVAPSGDLVVEIRADNGGSPDSVVIATKTITLAEWNTYNDEDDIFLDFTGTIVVGTNWIVLHSTINEVTNAGYMLKVNNPLIYGVNKVSIDDASSWIVTGFPLSLYFKTWKDEATPVAAVFSTPKIMDLNASISKPQIEVDEQSVSKPRLSTINTVLSKPNLKKLL